MVADWTLYEWKRRIAYLQKTIDDDYRLRKWSASRIQRGQNGRITLKSDALNFEFDDETGDCYIWRTGGRYSGGKMSLDDLDYLRDVIATWLEEQKNTPIPRYAPISRHQAEVWRLPKTTDAKKNTDT